VILHIITKGTVDEQIMKALETKEVTQDGLMNAVKAQLEEVARENHTPRRGI
jgi:hypothetical protein